MDLFHFTDKTAARAIGMRREGRISAMTHRFPDVAAKQPPEYRPLFALVWATDLPDPERDALGLTMHSISVDRTTHRFRILDRGSFTPYTAVRRELPRTIREGLESAPGAMPMHWFCSAYAVPVLFDDPRHARA